MSDSAVAPRKSAWKYLPLGLCVGWISAALWARWQVESADFGGAGVWKAYLLKGVLLAGAAWLVARGWSDADGIRRVGSAAATVAFGVVAASLSIEAGFKPSDAGVLAAALFGAWALTIPRRSWIGVALLGIAGGCSPLALGGSAFVLFTDSDRGRAVVRAAASLAIAAVTALLLGALLDRYPKEAVSVLGEVSRIGPQNVWREWAARLDLAAPVVVLALLAVLQNWFRIEADGDGGSAARSFVRASTAWMIVNAIVAICMPRVFIGHSLVLLAPAFPVAVCGWGVMRDLPLRRDEWALSLFSVGCYGLLLYLAWTPVRAAGELILIAVLGS